MSSPSRPSPYDRPHNRKSSRALKLKQRVSQSSDAMPRGDFAAASDEDTTSEAHSETYSSSFEEYEVNLDDVYDFTPKVRPSNPPSSSNKFM